MIEKRRTDRYQWKLNLSFVAQLPNAPVFSKVVVVFVDYQQTNWERHLIFA